MTLLLFGLLRLALAHPGLEHVTPGWSVEVRTLDQEPGASGAHVWLGLKNGTATAQAVCIDSAFYSIASKDDTGDAGGTAIPGSPHSCRELTQFLLTLPGETYFILAGVPSNADRTSLSFSIYASARDVQGLALPPIKARTAHTVQGGRR